MPYTIADWVRDHALLTVRLPGPDAQGYIVAWVPIKALTGEASESVPVWYDYRTSPGMEASDFLKFCRTEEGG